MVTYICKACDHHDGGCRLTFDEGVNPPEGCPFLDADGLEFFNAVPSWRRVVSLSDEIASMTRFYDEKVDTAKDNALCDLTLPDWFYSVSSNASPLDGRLVYLIADAIQDDTFCVKPFAESELKKVLDKRTKREIAENCARFGFVVGLWYDQYRTRIESSKDEEII